MGSGVLRSSFFTEGPKASGGFRGLLGMPSVLSWAAAQVTFPTNTSRNFADSRSFYDSLPKAADFHVKKKTRRAFFG